MTATQVGSEPGPTAGLAVIAILFQRGRRCSDKPTLPC